MKKGNIIVILITILATLVLVVLLSFIYYSFFAPETVQINNVEYTKINKNDYSIDINELNQGLFSTYNFVVNEEQLKEHEDLKDVYVGRANPFKKINNPNVSEVENTINDVNKSNKNYLNKSEIDLDDIDIID